MNQCASNDGAEELPRQAEMKCASRPDWNGFERFEPQGTFRYEAFEFANAHLIQPAGNFVKPLRPIVFIDRAPLH